MKMIGQRERFGSHLGLERIELVCEALGNPERDVKFIHVAGTNGKGSVAAFLASVLKCSGFRVGTFTSPHLEHYRERFQINGEAIDDASLDFVLSRAESACKAVEAEYPELGKVTEFELATAAGFLYFAESNVDIVVLETGLGGRLDATNVVDPILTVITTIALDHQDRLGSTLEEIACEKGGIIKQQVPVVSGVQAALAENVLKEIALEKRAPFRSTKEVPWLGQGWDLSGGQLTFPGLGEIKIGLLGEHQLQNGATALLALLELRALGWRIPTGAIQQGMQGVVWPGRLEILSSDPLILLDGAHNEESLQALTHSIEQLQKGLDGEKFTFLFGMVYNKSLDLLDPLLPLAKRFVFTAADSGRLEPMDPERMANYVRAKGGSAVGYAQLGDAMAEAKKTTPLCICGSLYLVGSVKRFLRS